MKRKLICGLILSLGVLSGCGSASSEAVTENVSGRLDSIDSSKKNDSSLNKDSTETEESENAVDESQSADSNQDAEDGENTEQEKATWECLQGDLDAGSVGITFAKDIARHSNPAELYNGFSISVPSGIECRNIRYADHNEDSVNLIGYDTLVKDADDFSKPLGYLEIQGKQESFTRGNNYNISILCDSGTEDQQYTEESAREKYSGENPVVVPVECAGMSGYAVYSDWSSEYGMWQECVEILLNGKSFSYPSPSGRKMYTEYINADILVQGATLDNDNLSSETYEENMQKLIETIEGMIKEA